MLDAVTLILLVIAFICFALAAFGVNARVNLIALGLAVWILTLIVPAVAAL